MRATLQVVAVLATLLTRSGGGYGAPQERSSVDDPVGASSPREAYFDGSAHLRLRSFVSVHRHSGLSFRACEPGRLFEQRLEPSESVSLQVDHEGLLFVARLQQRRLEARLNSRLLDNAWHNVNLFFRLGNLTLSAAGHSQVVANATFNPEILALPDHNANVTLIVGEGFRGCILQGPGILFNDSVNSNAIFGPCPLDTKGCSACLSNPCRNGGTCAEDQHGDFGCQCAPGFVGQRCESAAGARLCETSDPCRNDAACVELPEGDYRCDCRPGWSGRYCEIDVDECASHPCKNKGNCTDTVNGYTCNCDRTGYKGSNCEVDIDECGDNPCLNEGTCYNIYGGYVCVCPRGFEGQNCELNINECLARPCRNGAHCLDEVGGYRCNCTGTGFVGEHCDQSSRGPGCEGLVCPPNSFCLKDAHGPQCICKLGYLGEPPNCTINHCASGPCANGATCNNLRDRFECLCSPEWKGQ